MARQIAVVDSETDPFKIGRTEIRPFLWGFYDGTNYEEFTDTYELIKFLYEKPLIVYAHNGGKFDWHFIVDYIDPFSDVMIINGRLAKFKIGECEFRDSYNILPTPLSAYQKTKIDYAIFEESERHKKYNWKKIRDYLYDDCKYLYTYVTTFIDRFGLHMTQAGVAMKQWEKLSGLSAPRDENGELYHEFKHYYYGGRCQSFIHGVTEKPYEMVDINSAYPYAMLSKHPFSLDHVDIDYQGWLDLDEDYKGPSFFHVSAISKGALPFRGADGSLYFPDDTIERDYFVTGWEILAGISTNTLRVTNYHRITVFFGYVDFSDYIMHFYTERKIAKENNDKLTDNFCKLLMNSLYGKFGSNPDSYRNYQIIPEDCIGPGGQVEGTDKKGDACLWDYAGDIGEQVLISRGLEDEEQHFYNVCTAASITGYVRAFLWRAICACEGVYYCDTDSIAAEFVGDLPNGIGNELGQWESEGHFDGGAFAGRKLYAMKYKEPVDDKTHKLASKGTRLTSSQIYKVAQGEEVLFETDKPTFSVHKAPVLQNRIVKMIKKELKNIPG